MKGSDVATAKSILRGSEAVAVVAVRLGKLASQCVFVEEHPASGFPAGRYTAISANAEGYRKPQFRDALRRRLCFMTVDSFYLVALVGLRRRCGRRRHFPAWREVRDRPKRNNGRRGVSPLGWRHWRNRAGPVRPKRCTRSGDVRTEVELTIIYLRMRSLF
jgi:hypothetical protein